MFVHPLSAKGIPSDLDALQSSLCGNTWIQTTLSVITIKPSSEGNRQADRLKIKQQEIIQEIATLEENQKSLRDALAAETTRFNDAIAKERSKAAALAPSGDGCVNRGFHPPCRKVDG